MKAWVIGAALATAITSTASAQYVGQYQPGSIAPQSETTYDRRTGNRYQTEQNIDGSATVRGSNTNTGARWRTEVEPNGDMRGRDADGNTWRYNADTNVYRNSNGTTCRGEGRRRTCY